MEEFLVWSGDLVVESVREEQGSEGSCCPAQLTRATADPAVTFSDLPGFRPSTLPCTGEK